MNEFFDTKIQLLANQLEGGRGDILAGRDPSHPAKKAPPCRVDTVLSVDTMLSGFPAKGNGSCPGLTRPQLPPNQLPTPKSHLAAPPLSKFAKFSQNTKSLRHRITDQANFMISSKCTHGMVTRQICSTVFECR